MYVMSFYEWAERKKASMRFFNRYPFCHACNTARLTMLQENEYKRIYCSACGDLLYQENTNKSDEEVQKPIIENMRKYLTPFLQKKEEAFTLESIDLIIDAMFKPIRV